MKKLLVGALIVFLLAGVAVVGAGYYLYRQVRSTVAGLTELAQLPDIERGIQSRAAYVPPASEELSPSQVARLMRVQGHVRGRIGERFAEFERKYKTLAEKDEATLGDVPSVIAAYRDLAGVWLDAKRSQVDALNDAGFSLDEYRWVRHQAYSALGLPYVDLDLGRLTEGARHGESSGDAGRLRGAFGTTGPTANRKLIEAFRKPLEENLALASFGL